jgi:hypothetical protein
MRRAKWFVAVSLFVLLAASVRPAAGAERLILMDGIDDWRAEVFAGNPKVRGFVQGPKLESAASGILAFDSQGNAYVACETFIEIITKDGQARVLTGAPGISGNTDGPPGKAAFGDAIDIALVNDNLLYVVDASSLTLRKIERRDGVWQTETVAGRPGVNGHHDGRGKEALFTTPFESLTVDENGVVYLLDGDWLRKFENGAVTTLNGGSGYRNGPLAQALISRSQGLRHGLTYDGNGNLYIADKLNMAIRKVDLKKKEMTTIAGVLPGEPKTMTRDGKALEARFHPGGGPNMIFYNAKLDCLIARSDDESVIRIIKDGFVKTFGPVPAAKDPPVTGQWKNTVGGAPCGVDKDGNVYVMGSQCIRVVSRAKGAEK